VPTPLSSPCAASRSAAASTQLQEQRPRRLAVSAAAALPASTALPLSHLHNQNITILKKKILVPLIPRHQHRDQTWHVLKEKFTSIALAFFHQLPQNIFPSYLSTSFISKNLSRKDFFQRQISS
jgi:hypothetical protein